MPAPLSMNIFLESRLPLRCYKKKFNFCWVLIKILRWYIFDFSSWHITPLLFIMAMMVTWGHLCIYLLPLAGLWPPWKTHTHQKSGMKRRSDYITGTVIIPENKTRKIYDSLVWQKELGLGPSQERGRSRLLQGVKKRAENTDNPVEQHAHSWAHFLWLPSVFQPTGLSCVMI